MFILFMLLPRDSSTCTYVRSYVPHGAHGNQTTWCMGGRCTQRRNIWGLNWRGRPHIPTGPIHLIQPFKYASPLYSSLNVCTLPGSFVFYPFCVTDVTRSATQSVAAIYDKLAANAGGNSRARPLKFKKVSFKKLSFYS